MQAVLDLVWEHLLPAMGPAALPADSAARNRLEDRLGTLSLRGPEGQPSTSTGARVSGRTYKVRADLQPAVAEGDERRVATIRLDATDDDCRLTLEDDTGMHEVTAGTREWRPGTTTLVGGQPSAVAAQATWTDDTTLTLRVCLLGGPSIRMFTLAFDGDRVRMEERTNVAFLLPDPTPVVGSLD